MLKHSSSLDFFDREKKEVPGQDEPLYLEWELTQAGQIVKCNTASIRSLGYSQNELIDLSQSNAFLALIHAEDKTSFLTALQETKATAPRFHLLRMKHKKGGWRHLAYNIKIIAQQKNVHFSGLDITPLLKDLSCMFNEIRNLAQQLLAVVEACQTNFEEKSCRGWMAIGDLILKSLLDLLKTPIHNHALPDLSPNLSKRRKRRRKSAGETDAEKESKEVSHQNVDSEMKESSWNAESTDQDSSDIHATLDMKDGSIREANNSLKNILGYSAEEWNKIAQNNSQGVLSLLHENDRELMSTNLKTLQTGISCFAVARIRHHDSHSGYLCLGGYAKPDTALGFVYVSSKDLTPYLTDVRHLIHEARNVVQLIQASFAEIREVLENKTKATQIKQKEIISTAEQARLSVWNLLRILQRQTAVEFLAIKPVATNLTECISRLVALFRIEIEKKGLTMEVSLPKDALYMIDRLQVEGILINLITNALKYTRIGKITVSLNIENGQKTSEDKLKVIVSDTGIGISTEDMTHLFVPYYRTQKAKASNTGTGLGLPIVKQIVEKMGGTINLESKENQGTTVTLTFSSQKVTAADVKDQQLLEASKIDLGGFSPPNSQSSSPQSSVRQFGFIESQEQKTSCENEVKGLKILIVDDIEMNTKIYEKMLVKLGCVCTRVLSGRQAIEQLISNMSSNSQPFDIIFMDISMPELDGLETTRRIKAAKLAEQSIIIGISGNVEQDAEQKALEAGMVAYITKPATEKRIEATMRKNLPTLYRVKFKQQTEQTSKSNTPRSSSMDFSTLGLFSTTSATCSCLSYSGLSSYSSSSSSVSYMALQGKLLLLAATSSSSGNSSSSGSSSSESAATSSDKLHTTTASSHIS